MPDIIVKLYSFIFSTQNLANPGRIYQDTRNYATRLGLKILVIINSFHLSFFPKSKLQLMIRMIMSRKMRFK